jgi:hypothetical protein
MSTRIRKCSANLGIVAVLLSTSLTFASGLWLNAAQARTGTQAESHPCVWSNRDWSGMSRNQQRLWSQLGWTQARWDQNKPPASDGKDWRELSANQKSAAAQLGFTPKSWEAVCPSAAKKKN